MRNHGDGGDGPSLGGGSAGRRRGRTESAGDRADRAGDTHLEGERQGISARTGGGTAVYGGGL